MVAKKSTATKGREKKTNAKKDTQTSKPERGSRLARLSTFFVERWQAGLAIWLVILLSGAYIYTTVIPREGFPPISFPISFVSGTYFVDDDARVDKEVARPISEALAQNDQITDVEAAAADNFFSITVGFDESLNSEEGTNLVTSIVEEQVTLPSEAQLSFTAIDPGSFFGEYDMLVQVYTRSDADAATVDAAATFVAEELTQLELIDNAEALENVTQAIDPATGQPGTFQTNFGRVAVADENGQVAYYNATVIGVVGVTDADIIALSEDVQAAIASSDLSQFDGDLEIVIGADFARNINQQIEFLESNMLTGLLAVSLVSLILITWRASIITGLFMLTVMVTTIIVLYLIGYTLNVITLFALILSLGLFVDDATIVVEAIDVSKRDRKRKTREVVADAVKKVGTASFSGTLTTVLVFAILASPTGILGEFIRLIPVTVVLALLISFALSVTLIPLLSKFIILRNREPSWLTRVNPVLKAEEWLSQCIERTILSIRSVRGKIPAAIALLISAGMIMGGFYIFGLKVDQNTFPPSKDSDQIGVLIEYAPGTSIQEAQLIADDVEGVVLDTIGEYVVFAYYGSEQLPDAQQATMIIDLIPFTDRDIKAPEMVEELDEAFATVNLGSAIAIPAQLDNGPPSNQFPFGIRVFSEDTAVLDAATENIATTMLGQEMENFNGEVITILDYQIDGVTGQVLSENGDRYAIVRFAYDSENPTLVSLLTEERFLELYDDDQLAVLGVTIDEIQFDAGQEGDFQDSFATLLLAIPIALLLMYILLVVQFRSVLQPFLILLAIPFTIFGVAFGLFVTDNAASFFALTGFIGLIGIAVNNTIMLTDYANQERRSGKGAIESIAAASRKRFRPLVATSLTTVVALLPLALSDPFWESLAFTIIFGLLSSTFLVIIAFPYYYLLIEYLRRSFMRLIGRA